MTRPSPLASFERVSHAERPLLSELQALEAAGLYRSRGCLQSAQTPRAVVDGKHFVSFASNDYLGLAADPRVVAAAREGALRWGVGAGASHLLYGHQEVHERLEAALAQFVGCAGALLFSSGYLANIGVVTALCGREDEIFVDKLNHASLNDAMRLSRARFRRFAHLDLDRLEQSLRASRARRKLVAIDAVFSMDGDIAPVPDILRLCERYDALLLLDDAHGFGVLGAHGAGTPSHFRIATDRLVYMATLGKAAGVHGAFVAGGRVLIDYLVNRARSYIYTTAAPALLAEALGCALGILRSEEARRERLARLGQRLAAAGPALPGRLLPSQTAIHPLIVGEAGKALRIADQLADAGFIVPAIRPPTVPPGTARLRISLSAAHEPAEVERLIAALRSLAP